MSSAVATVRSGTEQLDRGAGRVQRATVDAAAALAVAPTAPVRGAPTAPAEPTPTAAGPGGPGGDLLAATTDLLLARTTVGAGAALARRADEAYRAVLALADPPRP